MPSHSCILGVGTGGRKKGFPGRFSCGIVQKGMGLPGRRDRAGGFQGRKRPGGCGIGGCLCLGTPSAEATGQSRWREEGEGLSFGMPGREATPLSAMKRRRRIPKEKLSPSFLLKWSPGGGGEALNSCLFMRIKSPLWPPQSHFPAGWAFQVRARNRALRLEVRVAGHWQGRADASLLGPGSPGLIDLGQVCLSSSLFTEVGRCFWNFGWAFPRV